MGRRWNVDPIFKAFESSYVTISNNPLYYVDPFGDNAWHPEDDGTGTGNQKLVADEGDLDRNTGKVDQDRLRNYLDQTVGSGNYTSDQFNKWVEDAECNFNASDCNIASVSLSSPNGQFNNLVGKYLINMQNTDPSWGVTKFKGNNCSPTTFNRVDQAVEFVYGEDYLGKLSISNPNYNAWQGNQTQGFSYSELFGPGVANKLGLGTIVTKNDIMAGTMKPGALISLDQRPGLGKQSVSWHAAIFLKYNYNSQGQIIGFDYWHHWTYTKNAKRYNGQYSMFSTFNFNNGGKYLPWGYKPMVGLNFK